MVRKDSDIYTIKDTIKLIQYLKKSHKILNKNLTN